MGFYQKIPVVIEAVKWNGSNFWEDCPTGESPEWLQKAWDDGMIRACEDDMSYLAIKTLEGVHICSPGDYVIQGVKGEIYPCKPDIFEQTYERVAHDAYSRIVCMIRNARKLLENDMPTSRPKSLSLTKLEEAEMWLGKAEFDSDEER